MIHEIGPFPAGRLWNTLTVCRAQALRQGALQPIATIEEQVEQAGVHFLVRRVSNLTRKAAATTRNATTRVNPFLPYEPTLFVADVTTTHVALLNKYPVFDHHLLIITRAYAAQTAGLTHADFAAWWTCLREYPALGFYNGGVEAGASQHHKHMQVVPLPLTPNGPALPLQPLITALPADGQLHTLPAFAFRHALLRWNTALPSAGDEAASRLHNHYQHMMTALQLLSASGEADTRPYNLLLTRDWMLLIARRVERYDDISINALAYAGSLLARDQAQLEYIQRLGPMTLLRETAQL